MGGKGGRRRKESSEQLLPGDQVETLKKQAIRAFIREWNRYLRSCQQGPIRRMALYTPGVVSLQLTRAILRALESGSIAFANLLCEAVAYKSSGIGKTEVAYIEGLVNEWCRRVTRKDLVRNRLADFLDGGSSILSQHDSILFGLPRFDETAASIHRGLLRMLPLESVQRRIRLAGAVYGNKAAVRVPKPNRRSCTRKELASEFGVDVRTVDNWAAKRSINKTPKGRIAEDTKLQQFRVYHHGRKS